ncbi:IgW heavy chain V region W26 [Platysternon megacephalum]|uniref:IgW heavy chain V region W26 n=1 Tax=Platysternon megacephalum TaxID=55544 RepID=A0A4D9DNX5_9SAUR|nr:IgW heavy chain V region W26 [Platysternon megacephalum]
MLDREGGWVAAITLTQPSSAQAQPGISITLDCVVSGYNVNDRHMQWLRLPQGKNLVQMASFRPGYPIYIADEFKGRVTPSTSGATGKLTIDSLTAADTATYYCATDAP